MVVMSFVQGRNYVHFEGLFMVHRSGVRQLLIIK